MAAEWWSLLAQRSGVCRVAVLALVICAGPGSGAIACPPASAGFYSAKQAAQGKIVFDGHCAVCHQANLAGGAGPPLAGSQFVDWLTFTKISGADLYAFISSQMPYDAPGSLQKNQYEEAFAYILAFNHYPAGNTPLDQSTVACIEMLPYPKQG